MHLDGIELLKDGIVLPNFRILSFFLSNILEDSYRVLDINSQGGYIRESIDIMCPKDIDYVGVDEDKIYSEIGKTRNVRGIFKTIKYNKMKLHTDSYDLIIAQNQYLEGDNLIEQIDNLFRASRKWIIFFNFIVLPECDGSMDIEFDGKEQKIYGVNYLRELFGIMKPTQLEYSFIVKTDNPLKPTPSIFVIKI